MEIPGSNATTAPENQPQGDWRAAFGSLRAEVVGLEGEVKSIGSELGRAMTLLDRIGSKVDALGSAAAVQQHSHGRISAQLILGMIAVITPIVIAAAALGHVFVKTGDAHLATQLSEVRHASNEATSMLNDLIKSQVDFAKLYADTQWTEADHERYHITTIAPLTERAALNDISHARLEERLIALTQRFDEYREEEREDRDRNPDHTTPTPTFTPTNTP